MHFPVIFQLGPALIPAHLVFEVAAYGAGLGLYRRARARQGLSTDQSLWLLAGAVIGAALGAKTLGFLEQLPRNAGSLSDPAVWLETKTIVGGLLGAWLGVEAAKRATGVAAPTGDATVTAFLVGLAIGRIGCFLTGIEDMTVGLHTDLPWAVDFGDGPRHPSPLYEIAFCLAFAALLHGARKRLRPAGVAFRVMVLGYLAFRFAGDFLKPREPVLAGLDAIQLASLCGMIAAGWSIFRRYRHEANHDRQALPLH